MIKAICVSSANDAAVAVAELVGGSEPAFVEQMNARAASLGMEQTSFRNACGLDAEGHLSTARDVAAMSRTILNTCPEVLHYTGIWTDTLRGGATQLINTNKLLRRYEGITGLKTGTTGGAGICISASATRNGLSLIAVILGAPSSADRFQRRHDPAGLRLPGPMRPRRCQNSRHSRSRSRSKAARRAASRWITRPCRRRCWWRRGAGRPCIPS